VDGCCVGDRVGEGEGSLDGADDGVELGCADMVGEKLGAGEMDG
jgi:hypothetical protein